MEIYVGQPYDFEANFNTGWWQVTPRGKKHYYIRGRRVPRLVGWVAMRWMLRRGTKLRP